MPQQADVIIVGSGPAGVSAAWPLVEAGVRVLMLDASDGRAMPMPAPRASIEDWRRDPDHWRDQFSRAGELPDSARSPKFATPLSQATLAGFDDAARLATEGYFAVGSLASGGLSRIWGALATEFDAADLASWGAERDDLLISYARVKARIGTSAPLMRTGPVDRLWQAHGRKGTDARFRLSPASNAVLAAPQGPRDACNACGLCLQGCGRGSIYQSAQELDALRRHRNFIWRGGALVVGIADHQGRHRVEVRCGGETVHFSAPVVVLAAGTLMSTRLALRRLGRFGQPVRLESNPVGGTAFLVPRFIGRPLPRQSFGLGQLFYTLALDAGVEAAGVVYGADTLPLSVIAERLPFTRPASLRVARALMPALVMATGYLPGRFSDNSLTLEDDGGEGRLVVRGTQSSVAQALLQRNFRLLGAKLRRLGGWRLPSATQLLESGSDAHPGATLPMGGAGAVATSLTGELVGVSGLFVADGSVLPTLPAHHPTLTIMANADRIGRALARRLSATADVSPAA